MARRSSPPSRRPIPEDARVPDRVTVSRRAFIRAISAGGAAALVGGVGSGRPGPLEASTRGDPRSHTASVGLHPLSLPTETRPDGLALRAEVGAARYGGGVREDALTLNGCVPSPTLRVRTGEAFRVTLHNHLPDDSLILHWHGITPPEEADGHPRFAVRPGESYDYRFTMTNRAGTYWYHSHTHLKVARHTFGGIAGMLIVEDDEEKALGLPSGNREIPLILQDRVLDGSGKPIYKNPGQLSGYLGDEPFGNGIRRPFLDVDSALYRFRVLNGSNARIFRLARNDGQALLMLGNDGGLLDRIYGMPFIDLAPAERVDLLVDLRDQPVGKEITLGSRSFPLNSRIKRVNTQGEPMDLLQLRVARAVDDPTSLPRKLSKGSAGPDPVDAVGERTFRFTSDRDPYTRAMMDHFINGKPYRMDRIDEHVPFGETEIWTLVNDSDFAHPVHIHATHFRILSRSGGRNRVMPWEVGLKDTVLLLPYETVKLAVRFDAYRGLFLIHCHNLEHEDMGMMLNFQVE